MPQLFENVFTWLRSSQVTRSQKPKIPGVQPSESLCHLTNQQLAALVTSERDTHARTFAGALFESGRSHFGQVAIAGSHAFTTPKESVSPSSGKSFRTTQLLVDYYCFVYAKLIRLVSLPPWSTQITNRCNRNRTTFFIFKFAPLTYDQSSE